jgi:hypothetical protein
VIKVNIGVCSCNGGQRGFERERGGWRVNLMGHSGCEQGVDKGLNVFTNRPWHRPYSLK